MTKSSLFKECWACSSFKKQSMYSPYQWNNEEKNMCTSQKTQKNLAEFNSDS